MAEKERILLFNDSEEELRKIYIELVLQGFNVEICASISETPARANRFKPHLTIISNDSENSFGFEVCTVVKAQLNIPTILLANEATLFTPAITCCKPDAVLNRPVNAPQLLNVIYLLLTKEKANQ